MIFQLLRQPVQCLYGLVDPIPFSMHSVPSACYEQCPETLNNGHGRTLLIVLIPSFNVSSEHTIIEILLSIYQSTLYRCTSADLFTKDAWDVGDGKHSKSIDGSCQSCWCWIHQYHSLRTRQTYVQGTPLMVAQTSAFPRNVFSVLSVSVMIVYNLKQIGRLGAGFGGVE